MIKQLVLATTLAAAASGAMATTFSNTYENGMIVANSNHPDGFTTVFACEVANMGVFETGHDYLVNGQKVSKAEYDASDSTNKQNPDKLTWEDRARLKAACEALVNGS